MSDHPHFEIPLVIPSAWGELNVGMMPFVVGVRGIAGKKGFVDTQKAAAPPQSAGIMGLHDAGTGVYGSSQRGQGVYGANGISEKMPEMGVGVWGDSKDGVGVYGSSATSKAGLFDGDVQITNNLDVANINVSGDITMTGGADIAEDFDVACADGIDSGTVLVIEPSGALARCSKAYDKRVAGVVSGAGEFKAALTLDRQQGKSDRASIALTGKVFCKVDADHGAIEIGDLLTTSATPGHAMKARDAQSAFGAVIGKALRGRVAGRGLIPILVALQ